MDDEETCDLEEDIYRSKDYGKKSATSRKQLVKESSTKNDGSKNRHATTMYVEFAIAGSDSKQFITDKCWNSVAFLIKLSDFMGNSIIIVDINSHKFDVICSRVYKLPISRFFHH